MIHPISVRTVQQAAAYASAQGRSVPSPGVIDGRWGPHTHNAFEAYIADLLRREHLPFDSARVLAPTRSAQVGATTVSIDTDGVIDAFIADDAQHYRPPAGGALQVPPVDLPVVVPARPRVWPFVLGFVGAAALVGGVGYFFLRR